MNLFFSNIKNSKVIPEEKLKLILLKHFLQKNQFKNFSHYLKMKEFVQMYWDSELFENNSSSD
jgi:hypothetical protein